MIVKFKSIIPMLMIGILAITVQSCFDADDYDMDRLSENVDWTPNMIVPVGYGTYSLWYLLNEHETNPEDQSIFLDTEGILHIIHTEKKIFSYDVNEVINIPNQAPIDLNFSLPDLSAGVPYASLPVINSQAKYITINTSQLDVILSELDINTNIRFLFTNPLNTEVELTVSLPSCTQSGISVNQTYTIAANAVNQEENLNLNNLNIKFAEPYSNNNIIDLDFDIAIQNNASGIISGSGIIDVNLTFENVDFLLAQGDFGTQNISIGSGNIDLDVDFWDDIEGEYTFADPKIKVHLRNSVGIPFQINANMIGYNTQGDYQALNPLPIQPVNYPKTVADVNDTPNEETITYDKYNSDIVEIMALPPSDRIEYAGFVQLNPNAVDIATSPNIVSNNSRIDADLEIDIPLNFSATNLMLRDTINDIDIDDAEKIINAAIVVTAENGYPLDVKIDKIYLTDETYTFLDSITDNEVIDAAEVFPAGHANEGEVNNASIAEISHEIKLSKTQIEHLNNTENLIINASVNTSGDGTQAVILKGDYELKFAISVQAQLDLNN
ncbi:hypothetical protein ACT3CE_13525 [Marinifilum sp. RC60d5]|uniref:hypothetical protein n=1 Tax=Marinifilum sp. RC60d5 TaxID=3458414 RepID=UPI0040359410